jgi:hypothetical protein
MVQLNKLQFVKGDFENKCYREPLITFFEIDYKLDVLM